MSASKLERDPEKHFIDEKEDVGHFELAAFDEAEENAILDEAQRKKLTWKLDFRLLPMVWLTYFVNLLDRSSIGGAVTYGFRRDVGLTGNKYNLGISIFFIFYCIFEIPSNLVLKKVSARVWLPFLGVCYGLVSFGTAFISTPGEFYVVRILLGLTECGTSCGISYYLSTYYDRHQLSFRIPFFLSASPLSAAISNFLATAEVNIGQIAPKIRGWQNIFFINGIITVGISIIGYFVFPSAPETTPFLTEVERAFILARSKRLTAGRATAEGTKKTLVAAAFKSPIVWFAVVPQFIGNVFSNSLKFFLTIVLESQFGWKGDDASIRSGAVFLVAFVMVLVWGFIADRTRRNAPVVCFNMFLILIGAMLFIYCRDKSPRFAGFFLASQGGYATSVLGQTWATVNTAPFTTRSVGTAIIVCTGSLGGILGAWVFIPSEAPKNYPTGGKILTVLLPIACISVCANWFYVRWENKARAAGRRDHILDKTPVEMHDQLGYRHPRFVYSE